MEGFKNFIKFELSGWKKLEILWMTLSTVIITALSIYWGDNYIGIISAVTGILCVIFTGKGKMSCYIFGVINTILYAYISFGAKYYGEVMLNLLYYVPMQFIGWKLWKPNLNKESKEVNKIRMSFKNKITLIVIAGIGVYLYGALLKYLGGNLPFIDSMSTVLSVVAMVLSVRRYTEQWLLWIVVNVVTVIMWSVAFINGGESIATLLMWSVYLLNSIFMYIKWNKESRNNEVV